MKHLAKLLKALLVLLEIFMALFAIIYLVVYMTGSWWLTIGGVDITLKDPIGIEVFIIATAGSMRHQVDAYLAKREYYPNVEPGALARSARRHRKSLRTVLWATWFAIYFPAFAYGKIFHEFFSQVGLLDLLIVLLCGVISIFSAVPMPSADNLPESPQ